MSTSCSGRLSLSITCRFHSHFSYLMLPPLSLLFSYAVCDCVCVSSCKGSKKYPGSVWGHSHLILKSLLIKSLVSKNLQVTFKRKKVCFRVCTDPRHHQYWLLFSDIRKFVVIDACKVGCREAIWLCDHAETFFSHFSYPDGYPSEGRGSSLVSSLSKMAIINLLFALPRPPLSSIKGAEVKVQLILLPCLLYSSCSFLLSR